MTLLICRSCPRYDTRRSGDFAREIIAVIAAGGHDVAMRAVHCLAGCPGDGVMALDGPGKARVRFTGLTAQDAEAVVAAARAHADSTTGDPRDWTVPPELRSRLSSVTQKRVV